MNQAEKIKSILMDEIDAMASHPETFAKHPGRDFTRERKFSVRDVLLFPVLMERDTLDRELLKYFDYSLDTPSLSAYYQQRRKLKPDTYRLLLGSFNRHFQPSLYKDKYILHAVDGSGFSLCHNPKDPLTFIQSNGSSPQGHNEIHVTATFRITDRVFTDAVIQPSPQKNEYSAICSIVDRCDTSHGRPVFIADRGFPSFNLFAHCGEKNASYLVRTTGLYMERLLRDDRPADRDEFDIAVNRIVVRSNAKKTRSRPDSPELYRYVDKNTAFDYIKPGGKSEYPLNIRAVRIRIKEGVYENLVTNLPADEFDLTELRILYHLRWGLETSFRELKHAIGAGDFHCRSFEYVTHEIWARFLLYNFCSQVTALAVVETHGRKYEYQVNFTMAIKNSHAFLRQKAGEAAVDILGLIRKYILPVRPERNFARQHRFHSPMKFTYRH